MLKTSHTGRRLTTAVLAHTAIIQHDSYSLIQTHFKALIVKYHDTLSVKQTSWTLLEKATQIGPKP